MIDANPVNPLTKESLVRSLLDGIRKMIGDSDRPLTADSNIFDLDREYNFDMFEWTILIEDAADLELSQAEIFDFVYPPEYRTRGMRERWEREVVPTLTISALAEFVLDRASGISFEPVSILGSPPCAAAGCFVGISELVKSICPDAERFGPSTPIRDVLSGFRLQMFWRRLGRYTRQPLPSLRFNLSRIADALLIFSSLFLLFGVLVDWAFLAMIWMICVKGISVALWLRRRVNPLPRGIVTFGDLARYQARCYTLVESAT